MLCVAVLALPAAPQAAAHSSGTGQMVTLFGYEHEAYLKAEHPVAGDLPQRRPHHWRDTEIRERDRTTQMTADLSLE